jgi:glutamate-1-semialdehyde 2,1-aminomutase
VRRPNGGRIRTTFYAFGTLNFDQRVAHTGSARRRGSIRQCNLSRPFLHRLYTMANSSPHSAVSDVVPKDTPGRSAIKKAYLERTYLSRQAFLESTRYMPGGVARQAGFWAPYPITLVRAKGAQTWDLDGNSYIDVFNNFASLVHGHAYEPIVSATHAKLAQGSAWAANNIDQTALARLISERLPSAAKVRFTNSGSEAVVLALLVARAFTGRRLLLMARYGYHGWNPATVIGSFGSAGEETLVAPFNDADAFEAILAAKGNEIAAVLLEPVLGSAGIIEARSEFLNRVKIAAAKAGALLIFDEVMTLRLSLSGAQGLFGVAPDLTVLGKIIGGGFSVGALAGRADVMAVLDPDTLKVWHSGTFNGNPVTMAAGLASMGALTQSKIETMERQARALQMGLQRKAAHAGLPFTVSRSGSLVNLFFASEIPEAVVVRPDQRLMGLYHLAAMNHGISIASRGMMALSTVMTDELINEITERLGDSMEDVAMEFGDA